MVGRGGGLLGEMGSEGRGDGGVKVGSIVFTSRDVG
jgi:hypothetical protein